MIAVARSLVATAAAATVTHDSAGLRWEISYLCSGPFDSVDVNDLVKGDIYINCINYSICIYVCMYVYMYVCLYICLHAHKTKETSNQPCALRIARRLSTSSAIALNRFYLPVIMHILVASLEI